MEIDFDFSGWEKINDSAYVYRNFYSEEICDMAFKQSYLAQELDDFTENPRNRGILLIGVPLISEIIDPIKKMFEGTKYHVDTFLHWYSVPGKPFGLHRDAEAYDEHPNKKAFGGVIYLAEMDGGILYYPESNTWMQPHKGDLVIQTSHVLHGAESVKGDNKRTITFVGYDTTKEAQDVSKDVYYKDRDDTIRASKDWLASDIGKRWAIEFASWGVLDPKEEN
jgi:hypothetical protein